MLKAAASEMDVVHDNVIQVPPGAAAAARVTQIAQAVEESQKERAALQAKLVQVAGFLKRI